MKLYNLNLQLFATQTTLLSDLSPENKTFYEKQLIKEAGPYLVHEQFGQVKPIPKNGGKTIEFRKFDKLPKALTPLTEGVTPAGNKLKVTAVTATVKQYGDYIEQSDLLELTAIDNTIVEATSELAAQAGLTMDTVVRDILNTGTNKSFAPKIGAEGAETEVTVRTGLDATSKMTCKLVEQMATKLKRKNAPKIDGYYVAIMHPDVVFDLMRDPEYRAPHNYVDPENLYRGEVGMWAGVRIVESTEAKIWKGSGCPEGLAVYSSLFMGKDAYGITSVEGGGMEHIVKQKGYGNDPLNQRSSVGWKGLKTAEILSDEYLIRCESTATNSKDALAN